MPPRVCATSGPFQAFQPACAGASPVSAHGSVDAITKLIAVVLILMTSPAQAQDGSGPVLLRGVVVDARTGEPLPKVLVAVEGGATAETGTDGAFAFPGVGPGTVRLYVSAVGYGLVQRTF